MVLMVSTENEIDTIDVFLALNQVKVMGKPEAGGLNLKLGAWMRIESVQKTCSRTGPQSTQMVVL